MPNIKSAIKRMKTSEEAHQRNKAVKSNITTLRRKFMATVATGEKDASTAAFIAYCSVLDKGVKKGVVKANTRDRSKSRAHARVAAL